MLIILGEIIQDAREYKEVTREELAEYADVIVLKVEEIDRTVWFLISIPLC